MNINKNEYVKSMHELMQQIEICGASVELTHAIVMAGDIMQKLHDDERLAKREECPNCNNEGRYCGGSYDDPEEVQCEFCWTNEKSVFYNKQKLWDKGG